MTEGERATVRERWLAGTTSDCLLTPARLRPAMFHPDDLQDILPTYLSAMQTGENFRFKYRIKRRDGLLRWHACQGAPVRDRQGQIESWMCSVSDVHEDTEAIHDALLVKERTKAVLEGSGTCFRSDTRCNFEN